MKRLMASMALAVCLLGAGCATTPRQPGTAPEKAVVLGSRIPQPVDPKTGRPLGVSPVFIISRDQLDRTGQVELGAALAEWPFIGELFGR